MLANRKSKSSGTAAPGNVGGDLSYSSSKYIDFDILELTSKMGLRNGDKPRSHPKEGRAHQSGNGQASWYSQISIAVLFCNFAMVLTLRSSSLLPSIQAPCSTWSTSLCFGAPRYLQFRSLDIREVLVDLWNLQSLRTTNCVW